MRIVLLALLLAIPGCKKKDDQSAAKVVDKKPPVENPAVDKPPVDKPPVDKPAAGDPVALYTACWDAWHAKDWAKFEPCNADDVVSTTFGMPELKGKAAVLDSAKAWSAAFPDAKVEPQLVMVSGKDIFSVRWFHGTHTGPFKGPMGEVPPTNKPVGVLVMHHVAIENGKIVKEQWAYDLPTLMVQLGLSKDPARQVMDKGWDGAPITVTTTTEKPGRVKDTYELWNKRDHAKFDAQLADDVVEINVSEPEDSVGKKAIQEHNKMFLAAFPDIHIQVENEWIAGDYSIEHARIQGTHTGDMGPLKKTGKKIDVNVLEVTKWKDNKVVKSWVFMNNLELASQLGLLDKK
jgi:predicted ester cyclase